MNHLKNNEMTGEEYLKISNCSPFFNLPTFSFEEVRSFLLGLDYQIVIHEGPMKGRNYYSEDDFNEVDFYKSGVYAIKPGTILPKRLDDPAIFEMKIDKVFAKEIKQKLLNL